MEMKVPCVENLKLSKILSYSLEEVTGQNIALHTPPTARNFCLIAVFLSH